MNDTKLVQLSVESVETVVFYPNCTTPSEHVGSFLRTIVSRMGYGHKTWCEKQIVLKVPTELASDAVYYKTHFPKVENGITRLIPLVVSVSVLDLPITKRFYYSVRSDVRLDEVKAAAEITAKCNDMDSAEQEIKDIFFRMHGRKLRVIGGSSQYPEESYCETLFEGSYGGGRLFDVILTQNKIKTYPLDFL